MPESSIFLGFLFNLLKESDIGKINFFKSPEIKQVDDHRDGDGDQGNQEERVDKLHGQKYKKIPAISRDFRSLYWCQGRSDHALVKHGIGNFKETGNVGSFYIVHIAILVFPVFHASFMDAAHDLVEAFVNLFFGPTDFHGIL